VQVIFDGMASLKAVLSDLEKKEKSKTIFNEQYVHIP
jgi:hypothetical protein